MTKAEQNRILYPWSVIRITDIKKESVMSNDMPDLKYFKDKFTANANEFDSIVVEMFEHVQQLIKEAEQRQCAKCAYQLFKFRSELDSRVPAEVLVNLEQAILNAGGE